MSVQRSLRISYPQCIQHFFPNQKPVKSFSHQCLLNQTIQTILQPQRFNLKSIQRVIVIRSAPRHHTYRNYIRNSWKKEMEPEVPVNKIIKFLKLRKNFRLFLSQGVTIII